MIVDVRQSGVKRTHANPALILRNINTTSVIVRRLESASVSRTLSASSTPRRPIRGPGVAPIPETTLMGPFKAGDVVFRPFSTLTLHMTFSASGLAHGLDYQSMTLTPVGLRYYRTACLIMRHKNSTFKCDNMYSKQ